MFHHYDVVLPSEAESCLDYTISGGESLLLYGVDDFGQILSWLNLADLSLEFVPSCRDSLNTCIDWFGTNRDRVEVAMTILRDARSKVHNLRYFGLYKPSTEYRMLIQRVCGKKKEAAPRTIQNTPRVFLLQDSGGER